MCCIEMRHILKESLSVSSHHKSLNLEKKTHNRSNSWCTCYASKWGTFWKDHFNRIKNEAKYIFLLDTRLSLGHQLYIVLLIFAYCQVALDVDDVDWLRLKFQYYECSNAGAGDACFPNAKLVECTISIFGTTFMQSVVGFPEQWDASEVEESVIDRSMLKRYLERSENQSCSVVGRLKNS